MASSAGLRRPRFFHSLGSCTVEFLHAAVEDLKHLPFPFGILVKIASLCIYPAVTIFEKLFLLFLAVSDLQIWLVFYGVEKGLSFVSSVIMKLQLWSGALENTLTAISSDLKRQGLIEFAVNLWNRCQLIVTDGTQKAVTAANEIPFLNEFDHDVFDIIKYHLVEIGGSKKSGTTPSDIPSLTKADPNVCDITKYQLVETDDADESVVFASKILQMSKADRDSCTIDRHLTTDWLVDDNEQPEPDDSLTSDLPAGDDKSAKENDTTTPLTRAKDVKSAKENDSALLTRAKDDKSAKEDDTTTHLTRAKDDKSANENDTTACLTRAKDDKSAKENDTTACLTRAKDDKSLKENDTIARLTRAKDEHTKCKEIAMIAKDEDRTRQSDEPRGDKGVDSLLEMIDNRWYIGPSVPSSKATKH